MDKKRIFLMILVAFIILIVIFMIVKNKKSETKNNSSNSLNQEAKTRSEYDEVNGVYTIYDKKTNEIITTTNDVVNLKRYEDNPDYNPNPDY